MDKIEWIQSLKLSKNQMEIIAAASYSLLIIGIGSFSMYKYLLVLIFGSFYLKTFLIAYGIWIYYDRERAQNGIRGAGFRWMRHNFFWKHFRDYFPVKLVKTAELPPNKHYLLGCYPPGAIGIGVFTNMAVEISNWNQLFPNVRPIVGTQAKHFNIPFIRHLFESWGFISVTPKSLYNNLTTSHDPQNSLNLNDECTATAVAIVVGGEKEASSKRLRKNIVAIKNRRDFIKLSIKTGAAIVPVFSFGEVNVFDQVDNSSDSWMGTIQKFAKKKWLRLIQSFIKKVIHFAPLLMMGKGFFEFIIGLLPQRKRIVQVVGSPIDVQQNNSPSEEDIDKVHQQFVDGLNEIFETHKAKFMMNPDEAVLVVN